MSEQMLLKLRLSLKGRPIKTYVFNKECVLVGRNPEADVFLDNPGVSRDHCKIELASGGYAVEDLNSANGTFLNDKQVHRGYLTHEDVIRVGKFSLWVSLEQERRGRGVSPTSLGPPSMEGTTVLRTSDLQEMMAIVRAAEPGPPQALDALPGSAPTSAKSRRPRLLLALGVAMAFALGSVFGAIAMRVFGR